MPLNKLKNRRSLAIVHEETKLVQNRILSMEKIQLTVIFHKVQSYKQNQSCQPGLRHQITKANISKADRKLRKYNYCNPIYIKKKRNKGKYIFLQILFEFWQYAI